MTGTEVLDSARDAIMTIITISAPLLIVGTIVGVTVSLFQALTQIQEQTLVFVSKIIATFATFLVALPFMAGDIEQLHASDRLADCVPQIAISVGHPLNTELVIRRPRW